MTVIDITDRQPARPPTSAPTTSRTLVRVATEFRSGRHILVTGQVGEEQLLRGRPTSLVGAVEQLARPSFDVVLRVNAADPGLNVVSGDEAYRSLERWLADGARRADGDAEAPDAGDAEAAVRRHAAADDEDVVSRLRTLMCQERVSVLVILDQIDILLTDPAHEEPERPRIGALRLALQHAARPGKYRNSCVMIAGRRSSIPAVLLAGLSDVSTVEVETPTHEEREAFLNQAIASTSSGAAFGPEVGADIATELAHRTDSDWLRTLRALIDTGDASGQLDSPSRLVNAFRYGTPVDHWGRLAARLPEMGTVLRSRIIGQDSAIQTLLDAIAGEVVGLSTVRGEGREGQPATLVLVGPTGVGKTEAVKTAAELVFGDREAYTRMDMASYSEAHHSDRLVGSPPGFVGYEAGGELTEAVRRRPNQIILFDEFEKAHPSVMTTLISVLEDGRLNDSRGQVAYFGEAILVFTSNLGSEQLREHLATASEDPSYEAVEAIFRSAVERHFTEVLGRPEILGRIKPGITVFDMLRPDNIDAITIRMIEEVCLSRGPRLVIDPLAACATARHALASPRARSLGVREIRNVLTVRLRRVATWCAMNQVGRDRLLRVELWPDRTVLCVEGGATETLPV